MSDALKIEERIRTFPDMPVLCATLVNHLNDPNADIGALADALRYDPGMTANILHLANSAYYGIPHTIRSLHDAVIRMGLNKIIQLMMARGIADSLRRPLRGYDLRPEEMLMHAAWVAVAGEEFCKITHLTPPATVFTGGLLHDIGKLIMDDFVFNHQDRIDAAATGDITHAEAETIVLGINHAEAGARLLERWGFPDELIHAARWHHRPEQADKFSDIVHMVHIANTLAHAVGIGAGRAESEFHPEQQAGAALRLTKSNIECVAIQTLDKMRMLHKALIA